MESVIKLVILYHMADKNATTVHDMVEDTVSNVHDLHADTVHNVHDTNDVISGWLSDKFVLKDGPSGQLTTGKPRAKNYTFVVYPEDLPSSMRENDAWMDEFSKLGHKMVVSPFHDKDVNADGSKKKSHYHVLLQGGRIWIKFEEIRELVKTKFEGRGVPVPQKCSNTDGLKRYMTHIDNPDKYQYSKDDIKLFNGADVDNAYKLSEDAKRDTIYDILKFIQEHEEITDYYQMLDLAMARKDEGDSTWFEVLLSNSWTIERYISSRRNAVKDAEKEAEREKRNSEAARFEELTAMLRNSGMMELKKTED